MTKNNEGYTEDTENGTGCSCGVIFNGRAHQDFYMAYLKKYRYTDVFHMALIYCLGIDKDTRAHIDQIYDPQKGSIDTTCLHKSWQTSSSKKTTRLAFNLYCNTTPSVYDHKNDIYRLMELKCYTVNDIFSCDHAPYFWQAVRLRYPEYCYR